MGSKTILIAGLGVMLCCAGVCPAAPTAPEVSPPATQPAPWPPETVASWLQRLQQEKLLILQLNERSGFFRSQKMLLDKIVSLLPDYYRPVGGGTAAEPAVRSLVPLQPRLYFTYGDYTGNVELPVISCVAPPQAVILKTSIINNLLPAFQSEDNTIKLFFADGRMRITNRRDTLVQLLNLSLAYNGRIFNNLLTRPITLPPAAMFEDQSFAKGVEQDLGLRARHLALSAEETQRQQVQFGFGLQYLEPLSNKIAMLSQVNAYTVDHLEPMPSETARLAEHLQTAQPGEHRRQFTLKAGFDTGEAIVKKEYANVLDHLGKALQQDPTLHATIAGHTDNVGTDRDNLALSRQRAENVKQILVETFKIVPERIATAGYGMTRPVASNETPTGRALNRRVDVRVEVRSIAAQGER